MFYCNLYFKKKAGTTHERLCLTLAWECLPVPGKALGTVSGQVIEVQGTASLFPVPGSPPGTHTYTWQKKHTGLLEQAIQCLPVQ